MNNKVISSLYKESEPALIFVRDDGGYHEVTETFNPRAVGGHYVLGRYNFPYIFLNVDYKKKYAVVNVHNLLTNRTYNRRVEKSDLGINK